MVEGRGAASLCPLIRGGILTNGLAAPVITDANYSGSAWTSLKLIPPPLLLPLPPPPPPGSFLSGAKGASPACRADWPARDDTKVPPPPNMASYLISTLAMGGRRRYRRVVVVENARRERYYDFRRFIRLIPVRGIFFVLDCGWFGGGGGDYEASRGGFVLLDVFIVPWIRVFRCVFNRFSSGSL